jgi:predicted ArsR family transcriptional regulator
VDVQHESERQSIAAVAALDDDVRRALFEHVRAAHRPITREDAAAAVGVSRNLAAFHLDKLVAVGLLSARYQAASEPRRVGRAPKVYEPAAADVTVSFPARRPAVLAGILVDALVSQRAGERGDQAAVRIARSYGERVGAAEHERLRPGRLGAERALGLATILTERYGFEPCRSADGVVRLRNCPFHPLAKQAPDLVCAINHQFLTGVLGGLHARGVEARLDPRPGECCVELRASDQ